jgi:hypothetical protein
MARYAGKNCGRNCARESWKIAWSIWKSNPARPLFVDGMPLGAGMDEMTFNSKRLIEKMMPRIAKQSHEDRPGPAAARTEESSS